jgi:cysteine-rich repeat protein
MRTAALFALLGAVAGCNQILGIGDVHTAASPDGGGTPDAAPNTVTGTSVVTYGKSDGTSVMKNEDLTGYTIRAYVPDGSPGGFQVLSGAGAADGTFQIDGVPDGMTYMLELTRPGQQGPSLYVTKQHVLDAGFVTIGRPDGVSTTLTTPVTMSITGMTAWADGDSLWADSYATGTENAVTGNMTATNAPAAGATSLVNAGIDWKSGYTYDVSGSPPRLVQNAAGDDFYVEHLSTRSAHDDQNNPITLGHLVDVFQGANVNMTDGGSTTISGAFTHVPSDRVQTLTFDLAQHRALAGDDNHYVLETYDCFRLSTYAVAYDGRIGAPTWNVFGLLTPRQKTVSISNSSYGDPFSSMWTSMMGCTYTHMRRYRLPDGQLVDWFSQQDSDFPAMDNAVRSPTIAAPSGATIGGQPFLVGGAVPFDGTTPVTVQWTAVPMAAWYRVTVRHIVAIGTVARADIAVTIDTAETSVKIPASTMTKGDFYNVQIQSFYSADLTTFANGHLRRLSFPTQDAYVFSGLFRFSSDCGNHVVDAGEQCDDGGESATCDSDCSIRTCGDGLVNMTAGEVCDDTTDSPTCDSDCTASRCGDNRVNVAADETCDDGNTIAGDGCSARCTVEACGGGVVDPGETCDDGNTTAGDGCSATCQQEPLWTCNTAVTPSVCTHL